MGTRPLQRLARCCAWLIAAGTSVAVAQAAPVEIAIEGLEDELRDAARGALELAQLVDRDATAAQIRRLHARGELQIRQALEPYGYYAAAVEGRLEPRGAGFRAVYRVSPGEPVRVRRASIEVEGDGADEPAVREAVQEFAPAVGQRLDHATYEASKAAVQSALIGLGYLDAVAIRHRVAVRRAEGSADIDLAWQSGPRYRLGEVRFEDSQFRSGFLQRFVPWRAGEHYSSDQLLALQQRLIDADYFAVVAVQPARDAAHDGVIPIDVRLAPAKRSVYTGGVFLSTDSGPGARAGFERRWLNSRGHKLRADLEYSQRLQAGAVSYRIPRPGANDRRYSFGASYRDEETDTSRSTNLRLAANDSRLWRGFTRSVGVQFLSGDFTVASENRSVTLFYPEAVLSGKRTDDVGFTRRGYSLNLSARLAQEGLLSDTSVMQLAADAKWIRALGERQRVILRGAAGAMAVDDFDQLPPELRFFAGGDRSVRGYDYQSIGETNATGQVIGGESLAVVSAEYEYYFLEKWGAAAFLDAGDAFRGTGIDPNVGVGLGIRWRSPVGVVRVDFAKPVGSELADAFRFHVVIGPDL